MKTLDELRQAVRDYEHGVEIHLKARADLAEQEGKLRDKRGQLQRLALADQRAREEKIRNAPAAPGTMTINWAEGSKEAKPAPMANILMMDGRENSQSGALARLAKELRKVMLDQVAVSRRLTRLKALRDDARQALWDAEREREKAAPVTGTSRRRR